jgi:hypothetical protein
MRFVAGWPRQGHKHTFITFNPHSVSTASMVTQTHHSCTVYVHNICCCAAHIQIKVCESVWSFWLFVYKHILRVLLCSHSFQYLSNLPVAYISIDDLEGHDSLVGIATHYGLNVPGIESLWRTRFSAPWGPTVLLYNWYRLFPGGKAARAWR